MGKPRCRWTPALGEAPATGQLRPPSSHRDLGTPAQSAPLHAGLLGLAGPALSFCWCGPAPGTHAWRTSCSLSQRDFQACWQSRSPRPPLPDQDAPASRGTCRTAGRCEAPTTLARPLRGPRPHWLGRSLGVAGSSRVPRAPVGFRSILLRPCVSRPPRWSLVPNSGDQVAP